MSYSPPKLSPAERTLIHARKLAKWAREKKQLLLEPERKTHKFMVAEKLRKFGNTPQMINFDRCGNDIIECWCKGCSHVKKFTYQCNRKWCPNCNWKITKARAEVVGVWAEHVKQPKHLVLTMRNFPKLTTEKIREFQKALLALRRQDVFDTVAGGCCSIEITNAGEGWHLHSHLLVDVRWLDMEAISIAWGKLVNQEFGIVKIKDVRGKSYLHEVTKYVAKGSELAAWTAEQLHEFVTSIKGRRFFFQFGSLLKMRPEIMREIARRKPPPKECECGCSEFYYLTEEESQMDECGLYNHHRRRRRAS